MTEKVKEFIESKSAKDKLDIISLMKHNSHFIWFIQQAYGIQSSTNIPGAVDPKLIESGVDFSSEKIVLADVIQMLNDDRDSFGNNTPIWYAKYIKANPNMKPIVDFIINGGDSQLSRRQINQAVGYNIVPDTVSFSSTDFQPKFFDLSSKWQSFAKRDGGMISIVKIGNKVEVYSKQGKLYRTLDRIRRSMNEMPIDGHFQAQLYFNDADGNPSYNKFLSEITKKDQNESFVCELFDFVPLSCISGRCLGDVYNRRWKLLNFIKNEYINDEIITINNPVDFTTKTKLKANCYVIDCNCHFNKTRPKNFMLIKNK